MSANEHKLTIQFVFIDFFYFNLLRLIISLQNI